MQIIITLVILPVITNYAAPSETTKPQSTDIRPRTTTLKPILNDVATSQIASSLRPHNNSISLYPPTQDFKIRQAMPQPPPRTLTKLAKTFYVGLSPSFSKDYFEPFERRVRPITLVAFRKNGLAPRHIVKVLNTKSDEVAELQSPYNSLSPFWQDESGIKI